MIYDDYIALQKLLDCNKPQADAQYALEESFFIRIHHIHEISFAQILEDLKAFDVIQESSSIQEKKDKLDRILACWKLNISTLKLLEFLKKEDFIGFRPSLTGISGMQSSQYLLWIESFYKKAKRYDNQSIEDSSLIPIFQSIHTCHDQWLSAHEEVILHFIQNDHGTGDTEGLRYMQDQRNHYDILWNEILATLNKGI